ncbi:flippase-like domain-containing protein [Streptomyces sp. RB6PN25]|uniref:Flippase-like domain-containing protein n=1 Tax=Streptomyces humicola TaxID=2953240 RepID=A0ABT1PYB0_9ACTN|nr:lysylphosphatidylglycerol synthase domain-containing protein [Streptomyces humicola]MCQ4082103.1 flippase-like domain-containing protein [Streptomyces humicola]
MAIPRGVCLRRLPLRQIACMVPVVVVGVWAAQHGSIIAAGGSELLSANCWWLLAAAVVTSLGWVAVSCARQGAVVERLPAGRLVATQLAAFTANAVLPVGVGATAVNLRFLRRCGLSLDRSSAALGLYLTMEATGRVVLLAVLLAAFPEALRGPASHVLHQSGLSLAWVAAGAVCAVVLATVAVRPLRRTVRSFLTTALADVRTLHTMPARAVALWTGSFAFPALQSAGLVAVAAALGLSLPPAFIAIAYLGASILAAAVPAPGGLGSVDASLVLALVTVGAPVAVATSVVLGYRIITVWLPLIPGALVLGALVRWKII